jgi:hypothetical protein
MFSSAPYARAIDHKTPMSGAGPPEKHEMVCRGEPGAVAGAKLGPLVPVAKLPPAPAESRPALLLGPEIPDRLEIVLAISLEGDEGAGVRDARQLHDPPGDHLGQLLVVADPDHGDDVGVAGNGVHLADPIDLG